MPADSLATPRVIRAKASLAPAGLLALFVLLGAAGAGAEEPQVQPLAKRSSDVPPHISDWLAGPGQVRVGLDGLARSLFQPEFRDAPSLLAGLKLHGVEGLGVMLMPPYVDVPPPKPRAPAPPPIPSRLLLKARSAAIVSRGVELLRRLDVPPRSAFISILASEVQRSSGQESGGSFLFDRGAGSDPHNTIFRSYSTSFEPDSYLRSNLTGVTTFQGTSLGFGHMDVGGGAFEYTLRMLSRAGCSQFIAWPNLVVSEGKPAQMTSVRVLPQSFLASSINERITYIQVEVGLKLRLTAVRIGRESAVLDLDVWLRIPEEVTDGTTLPGTLRLRLRQVRTRITLRDREPLMLGGLLLHKANKSRRGMPRPKSLSVLDPIHSALLRGDRDTEVCFLIRMRSVVPGRAPTEMRPTVYRGWSRGETRTDPFGR